MTRLWLFGWFLLFSSCGYAAETHLLCKGQVEWLSKRGAEVEKNQGWEVTFNDLNGKLSFTRGLAPGCTSDTDTSKSLECECEITNETISCSSKSKSTENSSWTEKNSFLINRYSGRLTGSSFSADKDEWFSSSIEATCDKFTERKF